MRRSTVAVLTVAMAATACGGDGGTGPSEAELTGTWSATRIEFSSVANPSTKVDLAMQGATATLTLSTDGSFTLVANVPGEGSTTRAGTWSGSSDVLTLSFTVGQIGEWQFDMTLNGDTLILLGADTSYDFNGDDQDESAKLALTLTRQ